MISDPVRLPGLPWPLVVRPHPRARRCKLRLDADRSRLLLTVPPRASRRAALGWAADQADWVRDQIARLPSPIALDDGATIPVEGVERTLRWIEGGPRTPRLVEGTIVAGGPRPSFGARIERWLRARARDLLSADTAAIAGRAGVTVRAVSVGDAGSRWGSCSASGAIRYNWRLVMAPPEVRRFVVAHEVAHRVHMDHGPLFKALEADLFGGDVAAARSALRLVGPRLKRIVRV